jgi:hypothetical protein
VSAALQHVVVLWAAAYSSSGVLRTLVAFVHIAGLVFGGGAAVAVDRAALIEARGGRALRRERVASIQHAHRVVLAGLAAIIVSGVLLFAADVTTYAPSRLFWIKMGLVAALMVNGALLVRAAREGPTSERQRRLLRRGAAVSLALWLATTLAGVGLPNI